MSDYIYVNGSILPSEDASLQVQDRGFRFGDGAFETIAIHNSAPYQLDFHLERLKKGLSALSISHACDWRKEIHFFMEQNEQKEGFIRITVSRGVGSKGYLPTNPTATVVIESMPPRAPANDAAALYVSQWRKAPSSIFPSGLKLNALGTNGTLALLEAQEHGADEALQLDVNGCISEVSSGNIFWFAGGKLYTPSLDCQCLEGSTRRTIMAISPYPVIESTTPLQHLYEAECVFVTNCAWGIWPVQSLAPMGWNWPKEHEVITTLQALYQQDIEQSHASNA